MPGKFGILTYFAVIVPTTILDIIGSDPSTFGTKFVTLFPWNGRMSNNANLTIQIINASTNETAKVIIECDNGLERLKNKVQIRRDVSNIKPNSYVTHKFGAKTITTRLREENSSMVRSIIPKIYLSSSSPVSIVECVFVSHKISDCFTVLPVTMAGNRYSFSIAPSLFSDIFTAYIIPIRIDSYINVTTITKKSLQQISKISHFYHGSTIYAYNSSISGPSTIYVTGASPFLILISMRTHLKQIPYESFACTMLIPLPDKAYSQTALRDDFDAHFTPLESIEGYRTQLLLAAPMQNCQPFTVVTFRPNNTKLIDVRPNMISNDTVMEWNHRINDAIVGYTSSNTLFQLLRFETYRNFGSFLDIIPSYSQYLTGRMCFLFKNENERLFLFDVPRQSDTFLLDGKVLDVEYIQRFENPFRYITMRKINTKKLKRGLHCLESKGRYLLYIFGGNKKMYGYVPAFNAYPMETLKLIIENNPRSYRHDIFGVSFITLFPWITTEDINDNSDSVLTLDILNPHPYKIAEVNVSYHSETKGNLIEKTYNITPYTYRKLEMNEKMMTKLHAVYSDSIYRSNYDSRITIKSSMPISVTQSCNEIGDSFAVLPLRMADRKYSFSLPKSIDNDSHVIIYFLPSNQTTKISIAAKFDGKERFHEIEAKIERNSPIFAYYGSAKEISLNLLGDNPFQVIIAIQQLLLANVLPSVKSRMDFACTMAIPEMQTSISYTDIKILIIKNLRIHDTANMQYYIQLFGRIFGFFPTILCRNDCIQIYTFGTSNYNGSYTDFIPSAAQYVTGRSHFAIHHIRNLIIIFIDENAVNDLEIDGVFAADDIYEVHTPYDCTYFTFKFFLPIVPIHYIQSSGRYVVHFPRDTLQDNFYQHFAAFGHGKINKETEPSTETTNQKPSTEGMKVTKSSVKLTSRETSPENIGLESSPIQLITTDEVDRDVQTRNILTSGNCISLARMAYNIITGLPLIVLIKMF